MTRQIEEIPLGDLNADQLEEVGRALDKPFEVDKRQKPKKIIEALAKHVQATGAVLTKDWPFQEDPSAEENQAGAGTPASRPIDPLSDEPPLKVLDQLIADTVVPPATQVYLQPHERKWRKDLHARLIRLRDTIS